MLIRTPRGIVALEGKRINVITPEGVDRWDFPTEEAATVEWNRLCQARKESLS